MCQISAKSVRVWHMSFFWHASKVSKRPQCKVLENVWTWRHQMETFSALLTIYARNSPVPVIGFKSDPLAAFSFQAQRGPRCARTKKQQEGQIWIGLRSPVNSPHKGQWRGALMFSLICTRINGWVNNGEAGDFRRYRAHYDVRVWNTLMILMIRHGVLQNSCLTSWRKMLQ